MSGFACSLLLSFAQAVSGTGAGAEEKKLTETKVYNIKSGIANPPARVCAGAALIAFAGNSVGTQIEFTLTENGIKVPAGSGVSIRLPDQEGRTPNQPWAMIVSQTMNGQTVIRATPSSLLINLREQLEQDTTLVSATTLAPR